MKESEKLVLTTKAAHENLICTVTQDFNLKYKCGHYRWVIQDLDGNIIVANSTTAFNCYATGGEPEGMVDSALAKELIETHLRFT